MTDDVLYGIDIERWLPAENAEAHAFTQTGWSWFGDGVEIMLNPSYLWFESSSDGPGDAWRDVQYNDGSGRSWQMVCSVSKSWKDQLNGSGLMPGEQRVNNSSFRTYVDWIEKGAMDAVLKVKEGGKGYIVEWRVNFDLCLEFQPGVFWNPELGIAKLGFNAAAQDLDEKAKVEWNFAYLYHEQWWTGADSEPYLPKSFGTIVLHSQGPPQVIEVGPTRKIKTLAAAQQEVRKLIK